MYLLVQYLHLHHTNEIMAGRPKIFEETEVINKAIEVFWTQGYGASSSDDLLAAMGIGKGSFYLAFKGGKKELYEKSLEQFSSLYKNRLLNGIAESEDTIAFLRDFFIGMVDDSELKKSRGCYIGNALTQMSNSDADTKLIAARLLTDTEKIFTAVIKEAQKTGRLKTTERPEILGRYLINLWNGINITRRMHPNDETLKDMIRLNLQVLQ